MSVLLLDAVRGGALSPVGTYERHWALEPRSQHEISVVANPSIPDYVSLCETLFQVGLIQQGRKRASFKVERPAGGELSPRDRYDTCRG
jgi:hypothetical protein